jgi:hypothetical protein
MRKLCRPATAVPAALALLLTLGAVGPASAGPIAMGECENGQCENEDCDKKAAAAVRAQPLCDGLKDDKDEDER